MNIEKREAITRELLGRAFKLSVGFGEPEILLHDLNQWRSQLKKYENKLKSEKYKTRVRSMLDRIDTEMPEVEATAKRQRKERKERMKKTKLVSSKEPRISASIVPAKAPKRRYPKAFAINFKSIRLPRLMPGSGKKAQSEPAGC